MTRRKTAASGTRRGGSRAVHAELSTGGGECPGWLRHREKQREPAIRCRQQQSVAGPVRTTLGRSEPRRPDDRRYSLWRPGAGGAGDRGKREKHVLGVWQGATENTTVVTGLLEDLVDRGLDLQRRYLVVIDGSKALRAGVERVFGEQAEVQRCQIHKRRNVKEYLPESCQKDYDRRMRNAYAMTNYGEAKAALEKIFRQLERINPTAARSLEEGLEETLTVHRLGIGGVLRRKLATTNPIESCLSTVQRVARNVKRWREGNQPLRWTATGLLEAEKRFRRIKGYQEILVLKERLNPSRIQQKEVRTLEVA